MAIARVPEMGLGRSPRWLTGDEEPCGPSNGCLRFTEQTRAGKSALMRAQNMIDVTGRWRPIGVVVACSCTRWGRCRAVYSSEFDSTTVHPESSDEWTHPTQSATWRADTGCAAKSPRSYIFKHTSTTKGKDHAQWTSQLSHTTVTLIVKAAGKAHTTIVTTILSHVARGTRPTPASPMWRLEPTPSARCVRVVPKKIHHASCMAARAGCRVPSAVGEGYTAATWKPWGGIAVGAAACTHRSS